MRVPLNSPGFFCPDCGKSVGARKPSADAPWEPQACFWCMRRNLQRQAARRRREHPRVLAGVDVDAAVKDLRTVEPLRGLIGRKRIRVEVGHHAEGRSSGKAWRSRIRVNAGPSASAADVLITILHELCHVATPRERHGERFRRVYQRALLEAWGVEVPLNPRGVWGRIAAYRQDTVARGQLEERISAIRTYPPAPKVELTRAERNAALVEQRAAHAAAKLHEAERKLKLAKTVHTKWARRVRYYERAAARKATK